MDFSESLNLLVSGGIDQVLFIWSLSISNPINKITNL